MFGAVIEDGVVKRIFARLYENVSMSHEKGILAWMIHEMEY